MNDPALAKLFVLTIILYGCLVKEKMRIIPLSPYEMTTKYVERDTTKEYFFAIENFELTKGNIAVIDSFVLKRVPEEFKKENCGINFFFYEYQNGKIDENFVHKEQPKQENLFMEADARLLLEYSWLHGKFIRLAIYQNGRFYKSEDRDW